MGKCKRESSKKKPPDKQKGKCNAEKKKKKTASQKVKENENEELSTVKCALRKKCKSQEVFDAIQEDVKMMSALSVESSRYIHFMLSAFFSNEIFDIETIFPPTEIQQRNAERNQQPFVPKVNFGYYFYALLPEYQHRIHEVYRELRGDLPLYDNSQRSNIMTDLIKTYTTSFGNNIVCHAWSRVKKFLLNFGYLDDNGRFKRFTYHQIRSTLFYLFYEGDDNIPAEPLLRLLEEELEWNRNDRFFNIYEGDNYFNHMKFFYKLQPYNEENRWKNFNLIPQFHFGALHIRYDTQQMFYFLKKLDLIKPPDLPQEMKTKSNWWRDYTQQNEVEQRSMWLKFFKPPETCRKKFNYSIQTDGVAVSFSMRKPKTDSSYWSANGQAFGNMELMSHMLRTNQFKTKIGLDPGMKLMVAGIKCVKDHDNVWIESDIKISSARYHHESGFQRRYNQLMNWTTPEVTQTSAMSHDYVAYATYQLSIFARKQREFIQRKVVRLKLKKYICVQKECVALAKEIVGEEEHENVFVAIGSTETPPNSPIKGYRRTPNRKLVRAIQERAFVMKVNEWRTTMLCSLCKNVNITSLSPHRFQFCPNCGIHWHRDVNAGSNILYKAECYLRGIEPHENFSRQVRFH